MIPMLDYDPALKHLFIISINGKRHRDTTLYTDREFHMIMDRYGWYMPKNIHAYHFRSVDCVSDHVMAYPTTPIPIYELTWPKSESTHNGLRLYTKRGPRSGVPIIRRYFDFVWVEDDTPGGCIAYVDGKEYSYLSAYTPLPITFRDAAEYVNDLHRHNVAPQGHKFSLSLDSVEERRVGVLIASEPKSRHQSNGTTLEINRCCTDSRYHNVCSALVGKAIRMGKEMGYTRFITYTLPTESGASMKAVGFQMDGIVKGRSNGWDSPSRHRSHALRYPEGDKQRWILSAA